MSLAEIVGVALATLGRVFGPKRQRFPYLTGSLPPAEYRELASQSGWKASRITVSSGIGLNGLVRRPQSADSPWVLFYQGNDQNMLRVGQAFLNRVAADHDWGLAIFAYRGYDSSDGSARLAELASDAPEILAQLCATEQVDRGRVHIVGFSIGGHLAVRAMGVAARLHPKPPALTLLAPVNDIVMVPGSFYAKLHPGDEFRTQPYLAAIPAPVLVVQGTADFALLGAEQGRAIAARLGTRARYLELPGVGHSDLLSLPASVNATRAFIAEHAK